MIKIPGLIDIHVHLRDPGQTEKEDFYTGTSASIAGGFTTVIDMPNNKIPITTLSRLKEKIKIAKEKVVCDVGFYAGSLGENLDELKKIEPYVFGLKIYLNETTGNYLIDVEKLNKIFKFWQSEKPILFHAEEDVLADVIDLAEKMRKKIHICHVSSKKELELIIEAKKRGLKITCGVTPHHLFLSKDYVEKLKSFAMMKPSLKSKKDLEYLWKNLDFIDVIESDHAPHTLSEKLSNNPPFGVPGLETTLPLLLTAVFQKKLSLEKVIQLCYENPKKIFNIKTDDNTYVEIDEKEHFLIKNEDLKTKAGWTPFNNWRVYGKVKSVYIRNKKVYENGVILVKQGFGKIL